MDIFNSPCLIKMLEKSSKHPRERILNLFDILEDWLDAPEINIQISNTPTPNQALITYLSSQAQALGAASPSILAEHIVLIARNASKQAAKEPNNGHLSHARKAAEALVLAQTQKEWRQKGKVKPALYGMAASVLLLLGFSAFLLPKLSTNQESLVNQANKTTTLAENHNASVIVVTPTAFKADNNKLTAQDAVTMYAKFEQMRNGTCHFPEALQIPDKHKAVYIESVVGGKLPADLADLAIANTYLEKVRCNYTPMLMARSR